MAAILGMFIGTLLNVVAGGAALIIGFILKRWIGAIAGGVIGAIIDEVMIRSIVAGGGESIPRLILAFVAFFLWAAVGAFVFSRRSKVEGKVK